jgi:acyl-coenzyme A synthetase/AMP-(fatty) acid ligase
MRSLVLRLRWGFSESISAKLAAKRNAVRFEAQNIDWTFQELQHYSDAVARGLWSLGLRKGDRLMLKLPRKLQAESAATRLGAAKLGAEVKASRATTLSDFSTELKESKAQGLIFDPSLQLDNSTLGSSLNQVFPKLHQRT